MLTGHHFLSVGTSPDLLHLPELRQLDLIMIRPQKEDQILISSITSINLQKITFSLHPSDHKGDAPLDDPCWTSIDDSICGLVMDCVCQGSGIP